MGRPYRSEHEEWLAELNGETPSLAAKSAGVIAVVFLVAILTVAGVSIGSRGAIDPTPYASPQPQAQEGR